MTNLELLASQGIKDGERVLQTKGYGPFKELLGAYAKAAASYLDSPERKVLASTPMIVLEAPSHYEPLSKLHFIERRSAPSKVAREHTYDIILPGQPSSRNTTKLSVALPFELAAPEQAYLQGLAKPIIPTLATAFNVYQSACIDEQLLIANRRGLFEHSQHAFGVSEPKTLIVIDADDLKFINDNVSYSFGDTYLLYTANGLRECLQKDDFVARYGGDEIIALSSEEIDGVAERLLSLQTKVARWDIPMNRKGLPRTVHGSVSIGYTRYDGSLEDAIARATRLVSREKERKKREHHTLATRYPQYNTRERSQ